MSARSWIVPLALAAMAAVVATAGGQGSYIDAVEVRPAGPTAVRLCWGDDSYSDVSYVWTVTQAAGRRPPPASARPRVRFTGAPTCRRLGDLRTDRPYTWLIEAHDRKGDLVVSDHVTGAARSAGGYVTTADRDVRVPRSDDYGGVSVSPGRRGDVHVAYRVASGRGSEVRMATRARGRWSQSTSLVRVEHSIERDPLIASNADGATVVAWNLEYGSGLPSYRVRGTGVRRWSGVRRLDGRGSSTDDHLDAVVVDRDGHLHFLVARNSGLRYITDATGTWTESTLPVAACGFGCDRSLMTYDARRDRVVVVANELRPDGRAAVRIADKPSGAEAFGPLHELTRGNRDDRRLVATSVAASGGTITVALQRMPPSSGEPPDGTGLFVMAGDGPADVAGLTRVPGTGARDLGTPFVTPRPYFLVAAARPDEVLLAWQRDDLLQPSWNRRQQGLWMQARRRDPARGGWRFGQARHVTASAYDVLTGLAVTGSGEGVLGHTRR